MVFKINSHIITSTNKNIVINDGHLPTTFFCYNITKTKKTKNSWLSTPIFQTEHNFNPLKRTFNPPVLVVLNTIQWRQMRRGILQKVNAASTILMTFCSHILYHMHKSHVNVDGCHYNIDYSIMESSLTTGHTKIELVISNSKTVTVPTINIWCGRWPNYPLSLILQTPDDEGSD